jgi:amidase
VSLDGVWPLAPSLDTVGPMARDVAGLIAGMQLLEPGFVPAAEAASVIGRLRVPAAGPDVDAAIDRTLATSELHVVEIAVDPDRWRAAVDAAITVLFGEAWRSDRELYERAADRIGESVRDRLARGRQIGDVALDAARAHAKPWRAELDAWLERAPVLALPVLGGLAPRLDDPDPDTRTFNAPINLSGHPALALPVPIEGSALPASVQLVGARGAEELLCATAAILEAGVDAGA